LNLINKLHGVERDLSTVGDEARWAGRYEHSVPLLAQLKSWMDTPQVTSQNAPG